MDAWTFDNTIFQHDQNIISSQKLLELLELHHGINHNAAIEQPPARIDPIIVDVPKPKDIRNVPLKALPSRLWFSIEDECGPDLLVRDIKRAVSSYFDVSVRDIDSARRTERIAHARQIGMFLARVFTKKSFPEIGRLFGGRDHTTALHAVKKIEIISRTNWIVGYDLAHIEATL